MSDAVQTFTEGYEADATARRHFLPAGRQIAGDPMHFPGTSVERVRRAWRAEADDDTLLDDEGRYSVPKYHDDEHDGRDVVETRCSACAAKVEVKPPDGHELVYSSKNGDVDLKPVAFTCSSCGEGKRLRGYRARKIRESAARVFREAYRRKSRPIEAEDAESAFREVYGPPISAPSPRAVLAISEFLTRYGKLLRHR